MQNNTFSRLFVGQNLVVLKRVDSTNNYLKNELANSTPLPEGTVILAEEQFAGRGQVNNVWYSEPGKNLTLSLLLKPGFLNPDDQFLLNQCISLAINDTLATIIGTSVKIKWPNDVYFNHDKLGGILIESGIRGAVLKHAIVGIGLNVNQQDFPADIKNVTSISKILHQDYDILLFLNDLCRSIENRYLQLKSGNSESIKQDYMRNLYLLNQDARFNIKGCEVDGNIKGVDRHGFLEVLIDGKLNKYNFKEIAFIV